MPNNLQFFEDPDDVPFINENMDIFVATRGNDTTGNGSQEEPFRTLGKAVSIIRNKQIGKNNFVTINIGEMESMPDGSNKKYFEEEEITIDFDSARRVKIKGKKPTDHEVIAISYFDKASDRDGFYCQVLVTNHDKISIGNYLGIYDHLKIKKKDPSHFWVRNNISSPTSRTITTNNNYVEALRCDMILGVHEVVDIGPSMEHTGNYANLSTEIFDPLDLKIGLVTVHIKSNNHTHKRLNEVPYWNTLGTKGGDALFTYAGGPGNSPLEARFNSNTIPPIFYGAAMLSSVGTETLAGKEYEQFYFSDIVQQLEIIDILLRGYKYPIDEINGRVINPFTGLAEDNVLRLWNNPALRGEKRNYIASVIAPYLYQKISRDLRIDADIPWYFAKSNDALITTKQISTAAKKIRDFLLAGAKLLNGVPPWDEDNHPGYGYGPFESGAVRPPVGGTPNTEIDTQSYPQEYANKEKISILLRYYNIYPPINGQMYQPILIKRINTWYNENSSFYGLRLDRFEKKGNQSPFFCGYITPQGWYKQRYVTNPIGTIGNDIPSLKDTTDINGYHLLFGDKYPKYIANPNTIFTGVSGGSKGAFSNERSATKNLSDIDQTVYLFEESGVTSGGRDVGNTLAYTLRGSMGSVWYSGLVNFMQVRQGSGAGLGLFGDAIFDRYSLGYITNGQTTVNDNIISKDRVDLDNGPPINFIDSPESTNIRAKCFKSILRFGKSGITVTNKTKLGFLKDVCLVGMNKTESSRFYGLMANGESVINASNIGVSSFSCGISARNQSLINLLADLKDSNNTFNRDIMLPIDPGAIVTANGVGIESSLKSHVNAQRTVSSGSKKGNYLAIANSSMDCSNSMSVSSHKHGYVVDFNSYMRAINSFSEFNTGIGYCVANNSILICHRSRSIWNGSHGLYATTKSTAKCYEFISRSNDGDGLLAENTSLISAGANSANWANYRRELIDNNLFLNPASSTDYYGIWSTLPPHLYNVTIITPEGFGPPLPKAVPQINSNPTHGIHILYHECNSTISEFNAGSGFASCSDSMIVADNTISRYNSKKYGEFFVYGWSGLRGSFPTDTFATNEFIPD